MSERPILFSGDMVNAILQKRKRQTRRIMNPQPVHTQHHVHKGKLIYEGEHRMWCWKDLVLENIWDFPENDDRKTLALHCPKGRVEDGLWVRESWTSGYQNGAWGTIYRADGSFGLGKRMHPKGSHFHAKEIGSHIKWRPSIHLPRWASRLNLEIEGVRVQKLQEISEEDAMAEGAFFTNYGRKCFHGKGVNPVGDCPAPERTHPKHDGWSMVKTTSHEQCLGSAKMAFANYWCKLAGDKPCNIGPAWDANPFVWAISFKDLSL